MSGYAAFLESRAQAAGGNGFDPPWVPDFLFPFQRKLVDWSLRLGRAAIFADCGMGKSPMQLVWASNVASHTGKPVLILTPLAVSHQTIREAEKFGIEAARSQDGTAHTPITITNYERLDRFNAADFAGVVCDESSILKSFEGVRRGEITEFMRRMPYRLLCTATAAPNDFIELGTSSEALGGMGFMDVLGCYFRNERGSVVSRSRGGGHDGLYRKSSEWRFKGHAERPFWRWAASWARALRKPSDLGCDDSRFALPPLNETQHVVTAKRLADGMLFALPAVGLSEQREERRRTIVERCERMAELVNHDRPAMVWCHLNAESALLAKLIPGCVEVSGADSDDDKEAKLLSFCEQKVRVLVTKPKIGAWGLNLQHCAHVAMFPSHSYEQYYQAIRRCWRFGQTSPVQVDIVTTEGETTVLENLQKKMAKADQMFTAMVAEMNHALTHTAEEFEGREEVPGWL